MPPQPLFDLSRIDPDKVIATKEQIYRVNPHRYEFELLDGIYFLDHEAGEIAGYRQTRADEFWVRGHIPGRPLFPGVLMIETAAQLVSYFALTESPGKEFMGFAAVDEVKFRGTVVPGDRFIVIAKRVEVRPRRWIGATQAFVGTNMVYEGVITGMWL